MDDIQFDALTLKARTMTRTSAVMALGGAAAAVLGATGVDAGNKAARRRRKREKRRLRRLRRQPCGQGGDCRVFITSNVFGGSIGGLQGADVLCKNAATVRGLPGTYRAWLSDASASPSTRFVQNPGRYRLLDGTTIADSWDDLTDGTLDAPITVTEQGNPVNDTNRAWTNTLADGTPSGGNHCDNWTNAGQTAGAGQPQATNVEWTTVATDPCNTGHHIYCFQQDGPRF